MHAATILGNSNRFDPSICFFFSLDIHQTRAILQSCFALNLDYEDKLAFMLPRMAIHHEHRRDTYISDPNQSWDQAWATPPPRFEHPYHLYH